MEITHFETEVLERSHEVPVVVDFWAPWCGPCQFLGPIIESLEKQAQGTWELAKVNIDQQQKLAVDYNVRSIPAVKMFHKGKIIADFVGSLPKTEIQKWLTANLPDPRKDILEDLRQKLQASPDEANRQALEDFVKTHPDLQEGRLWLAFEKVYAQPQEALKLIEDIKIGNSLFDLAEDVRNLAAFMTCEAGDKPKLDEKISIAQEALRKFDKDTALQNLIEVIMVDKSYCQENPRKAAIALFHFLGMGHELTKKYRRRFDMALY